MRNEFGIWIAEAAKNDSSIILIVGDIGYGIFDEFRKEYPERFINCGIAEQNMIGVAAGLAAQGFKPYVYTIIPFLIYRPFEFIRNLIAYQKLGVTLVGVGGGFSYDNLGFTHHAVEDIGLIMNLPNFKIYVPYDPKSCRKCFDKTLMNDGPSYIRLMKGGEKNIEYISDDGAGYSIFFNSGNSYTILTHGSLVEEAIAAAMILLEKYDIAGKVIATYSEEGWDYISSLRDWGYIFIFEEHIYPGLYDRFIQRKNNGINKNNIININIDSEIEIKVCLRKDMLKINGLDRDSIYKKILNTVTNNT